MPEASPAPELLRQAESQCRQALDQSPLREIAGAPPRAFELLSAAGSSAASLRSIAPMSEAGSEEAFARALLLSASLYAIPRLLASPFPDSVKSLWAEQFGAFAQPPERWRPHFRFDDIRFHEFCRIATLRRVPAGQFHWEISGIPRSVFLAVGWAARFQLARLIARMGGRGPLAETHVNDLRRNRLTLTEDEGALSYYRLARTLELQPGLRGLMTSSWLYCRTTSATTPRLAWLRRFFEENGALLADLGPAPEDSGFLVGSEDRARLYREGSYRPRMTLAVWPRRAILAWAARHPELAEPS